LQGARDRRLRQARLSEALRIQERAVADQAPEPRIARGEDFAQLLRPDRKIVEVALLLELQQLEIERFPIQPGHVVRMEPMLGAARKARILVSAQSAANAIYPGRAIQGDLVLSAQRRSKHQPFADREEALRRKTR